MFTKLNQELYEVKESLRKKKKYEEQLQRTRALLEAEKGKKAHLKRKLEKEKEDVTRLETFTLTNIFYSITGRKLEKLDKEQQEVLAAKLKYKEALETIEELEIELNEYEQKWSSVVDAHYEYERLLKNKEQLIHTTNKSWSETLYRLVDQEAEGSSHLKEYDEAIAAGEKALEKLKRAIQSLDSAKGWSTFDMFGGGMITTAVKHGHLDEAKNHIHGVQKQLRKFQDELLDIENHFYQNFEIGGLLTFADYFFDGIIFDWLVHGQISECYDQAVKTEEDVAKVVGKLTEQREELKQELEEIKKRKTELLENAH